ncbi:MAG: hypothetical protein GWO20_08920, partial [Candidatus Korarchaeota archaeon]|nr:hypothetical protein [Candidatus Korarchaeota archaeon]NIU83542.1 hypothetical protein [Candidatus Thorarchaeota archaeon]NIW13804.1 hypothetical protein [Candidatus Thorarchaeota archaeon]
GLLTNAKEVNVSWIASDNTTSLSFKVYLNGELINETGEYVYELSLTEGTHTIGILAVDGAGNSKLDTIDLRVVYDYKPPALNFWTANGTVFSDDDINIRLEV